MRKYKSGVSNTNTDEEDQIKENEEEVKQKGFSKDKKWVKMNYKCLTLKKRLINFPKRVKKN